MLRRTYVYLFVFAALLMAGGLARNRAIFAQTPAIKDKPVWTLEYLKVMPGKFGPALGYLDDSWMRVREEAKRQGAVLSYDRIAEEGNSENERTIVLLTEYKNKAAYDGREKLFAAISKRLENTPGVITLHQPEELWKVLSDRVYQDYTERNNAQFRLLAEK
jgi:hypothetical protein